MKSNVTEIATDVYRISTFHPDYGIQFNQFLIKDDEPFMMHTGLKKMFPVTFEAVLRLLIQRSCAGLGSATLSLTSVGR